MDRAAVAPVTQVTDRELLTRGMQVGLPQQERQIIQHPAAAVLAV